MTDRRGGDVMKILFAAPENAWGGVLGMLRAELPEHEFVASGRFGADTLKGYDIMIPTMCTVTREMLQGIDRLRLIQQIQFKIRLRTGLIVRMAGIRGHPPVVLLGPLTAFVQIGFVFRGLIKGHHSGE